MRKQHAVPLISLCIFIIATLISLINPYDGFTWVLEAAPALIGVAVLVATYRSFRFSNLAYVLILLHACILLLGAHYTYAQTPIGFWAQELFGWTRNNYDKVGHFAQGFVPAIIVREILIRKSPITRGGWLSFFTSSVCLAISACYELLEWLASALSGSAADAFLGTQGYVWDTQSDMLMALIGALCALIVLRKIHDRSIISVSAASEHSSNLHNPLQ